MPPKERADGRFARPRAGGLRVRLAQARGALMQLALLGPFTDQMSWARVARHARCADGDLDPDQWFPVSTDADSARQEAAAAIAICTTCLVCGQCLALSLRYWDIGQHGVWGGLVGVERAALRRRVS
jgi:Transcription factor WhiB